jgi:hypothetical protein
VEGVPHTVCHFHGLWDVASLIGTPLDVDLVTVQSRGVVHVRVAMMEPKNLDRTDFKRGKKCLGVTIAVNLQMYDIYFAREAPDFVPDPSFTPYF